MLNKESVQTKSCDKLMRATLLLTVDHCLRSHQILAAWLNTNTYIFKQVTMRHVHLQEARAVLSPCYAKLECSPGIRCWRSSTRTSKTYLK